MTKAVVHNYTYIKKSLIPTALLLVLITVLASACNKKSEAALQYEPAPSVAVLNFKLKANPKVMASLDTVFFSIDLEHGVIFNADSLPVGTPVNKIVPVITYSNSITSAIIEMNGGTTREGTVDYMKLPGDSIDFTGNVRLTLKSADNLEKSYRIKVNVHLTNPDSLIWDKVAVSAIPSRFAQPKRQKTIQTDNSVATFIEEDNGTFTFARTINPSSATWEKQEVMLPFSPNIDSFTTAPEGYAMLATDGTLFTSANGITWSSTQHKWTSIIGAYSSSLLGVSRPGTSGQRYIETFPATNSAAMPLPQGFPTEGFSSPITVKSQWATNPILFISGGINANGTCAATWAFDGNEWAEISNNPLPAISNLLVVPYFYYRQTSQAWIQTEYSVWLAMGGVLADGSQNRTVYLSYDNGVNWSKAPQSLQLPAVMNVYPFANAAVCTTPLDANLSDAWTKSLERTSTPQKRISYFIDGDDISWDCPYIYIFGGIDDQGTLNNAIYRAVLGRLTFAPII